MSVLYRVALEGFGAFERRSLESFFLMATGPGPRFDPSASLSESDLCVVDSDRTSVVDEVRRAGRMGRSVFVGGERPDGAVVHLGRPINPRLVSRALETLLLALPNEMDPDVPGRLKAVKPPKPAKPVLAVVTGAAAASGTSGKKAEPHAQFPIDVLVFENNADIAASVLIAQLEKLGCRVSVGRHAEEAPRLLAQNPVRMVFSDVSFLGTDGLALCQQIKAVRKGAPSVVLMSPQVTSSDRVRAQLAGADALLAKPVDAGELLGVLHSASNRRRRAR
jgi:CheY-like chemotaxis protein